MKVIAKSIGMNRIARHSSLGGGTLIFSPQSFGWLPALEEVISTSAPLFTFGTGVRDPDFNWSKTNETDDASQIQRWIECLRKFQFVSVRGVESKRLLLQHGLENVEVVGDPALYFARDTVAEIPQTRSIGVNVSRYGTFWKDSKEHSLSVMRQALRQLSNDGWQITLFPSMPEDVELLMEIADKSGISRDRVFPYYADREKCMGAVRSMDVFVAFKLHLAIAAFCNYVPCIMIGYQPKATDFMRTVGFEESLMTTSDVTVDRLLQAIETHYESSGEIKRRQYEACSDYKKRLLDFARRVTIAASESN